MPSSQLSLPPPTVLEMLINARIHLCILGRFVGTAQYMYDGNTTECESESDSE